MVKAAGCSLFQFASWLRSWVAHCGKGLAEGRPARRTGAAMGYLFRVTALFELNCFSYPPFSFYISLLLICVLCSVVVFCPHSWHLFMAAAAGESVWVVASRMAAAGCLLAIFNFKLLYFSL